MAGANNQTRVPNITPLTNRVTAIESGKQDKLTAPQEGGIEIDQNTRQVRVNLQDMKSASEIKLSSRPSGVNSVNNSSLLTLSPNKFIASANGPDAKFVTFQVDYNAVTQNYRGQFGGSAPAGKFEGLSYSQTPDDGLQGDNHIPRKKFVTDLVTTRTANMRKTSLYNGSAYLGVDNPRITGQYYDFIGHAEPTMINGDQWLATPVPPNPTVSSVQGNQFTVTWNPIADATSYELFVGTTTIAGTASTAHSISDFVTGFSGKSVTGTSHVVTGLQAATPYYVGLKSVTPAGKSIIGQIVSQTTAAGSQLQLIQALTPTFIAELNDPVSATTAVQSVAGSGWPNFTVAGTPVFQFAAMDASTPTKKSMRIVDENSWLFSTTTTPFLLVDFVIGGIVDFEDNANDQVFFALSSSTSAAPMVRLGSATGYLDAENPDRRMRIYIRNDASFSQGSRHSLANMVDGNRYSYVLKGEGAGLKLWVNGVLDYTTTSFQPQRPVTLDTISIGALVNTSVSLKALCNVQRMWGKFSGTMPTDQQCLDISAAAVL